jgi:hypothetical protein
MSDVKNLQNFYNVLKTQGVRLTHQYQLNFTIGNNAGLPSIVNDQFGDVTIWAEGSQVPGREQNVTEMFYLGYPFIIPTNMIMTNELSLNIRVQNDMSLHTAMLAWKATISDPDIENGATGGGDKTLRDVRARMDLLDDKMETIVASYEMIGIYPTNVGSIEFSNSNADVATFASTFRFQYWRVATLDGSEVTGI